MRRHHRTGYAGRGGRIGLVIVVLSLTVWSASAQTPGVAPEAPAAPSPAEMRAYTEEIPGTALRLEMVPIPAGTEGHPAVFTMGSPADEAGRGADEGPTFEVEIAPFWMGRCEVTWDLYDEFRRAYAILSDRRINREEAPAETWADAVSLPTPLWDQDSAPILQGLGTRGGYPVADISQFAARQFTKWLSARTGHFYRLPTEAEWEYAARAGTKTAWFFGDDPEQLGDFAWNFDTSAYDDPEKGYPGAGGGYRKVGLKKPNPWGLHDIYGNVSEWVIDQYRPEGYARSEGASLRWDAAIAWPKTIFPCVVRGGNWESDPEGCRSAARLASTPKWQYRDPQIPKSVWWFTDAFHVGFRVVRPLHEPTKEMKQRFWDTGIEEIHEILQSGGKQARVPIGGGEEK